MSLALGEQNGMFWATHNVEEGLENIETVLGSIAVTSFESLAENLDHIWN